MFLTIAALAFIVLMGVQTGFQEKKINRLMKENSQLLSENKKLRDQAFLQNKNQHNNASEKSADGNLGLMLEQLLDRISELKKENYYLREQLQNQNNEDKEDSH